VLFRSLLDVPYLKLDDEPGLAAEAARAKAMGYTGKIAIHPKQVAPIQRSYTPTAEEIERARGMVDALARAGGDVVEYQGRMLEGPIVRGAQRVLAIAQRLA
jgi:(S)-citramalyl-CoA lyase